MTPFTQACGSGYDPVMLALHGFQSYGLEISATAVCEARKYVASKLRESTQQEDNGMLGVGDVQILEGDFFANEWQSELPFEGGKFDLVYDYTVSFQTRAS